MSVKIKRYPSDKKAGGSLNFSILESVSLSYDMSWESVPIYGRQDAVQSYKTTGQTISISVAKTFRTAKSFKILINNLNKFSRPIYENGVIVRSPLWQITLLGGNGYVESPFVIAPSSISVDYGDRLRKIEAVRLNPGSRGVNSVGNIFGNINAVPKRVSVSISGVLINTKRQYTSLGSAAPAPGPIDVPNSPLSNAKTIEYTRNPNAPAPSITPWAPKGGKK
jgi:hypothetical protein